MRKSKSPVEWQKLVDGHKSSGLSVVDYCKENDINTRVFYQWRSKFQAKEESNFIELPLNQEVHVDKAQYLYITTPSGLKLEVPL